MKIGVNTLFLIPGEVGGTETYLREVLLAMAKSSEDIDWVLFTNRENDSYLKRIFGQFPKFAFHPLPLRATNRYARIIWEQAYLPFRVALSHVDLLWSPGYTVPFFVTCPQMVTIPDMQYRRYPEDLTFLARIATDILVRMAAKRCRGVFAISEFSRKEILTFTHAREGSVRAVHLAVDPAFAQPIPADIKRQRLKRLLPSEKPYILCIANTYPHKNVHVLIEAFGQIMEKIPHQLVLVGKPRLGEPEVQKALCKVPDMSRFQRLLQVDRENLFALYQGAALFAFPSLYEGFGLPVLEAMMSGVPVLTTRCGSIPEVGGDKVCYFDHASSTDLARQMIHIVSWKSDYRKIRVMEAQKHACQFSWHQTAAKTIEGLKQMTVAQI
ncbi:MAG: glycosyltransferase family 4 protein [Deltaproteobacteria bacterium]|nr:glycosyltransferase family 4 protein [Deltaproteobacteria bacterium]